MRKLLLPLAGTALFAVAWAMPAQADPEKYGPEDGKDAQATCKYLVDNEIVAPPVNLEPFDTVGECMGVLRSGGVPGTCQYLDSQGLLEAVGFKNRGACVSSLRKVEED